MTKHNSDMSCLAKYIACGMIIGSALGTGTAVLLKSTKKSHPCKCMKKTELIRGKAANAMDTIGTIMQNLADMTR